jgi:4-hydroxybenzoate polyprenyltransferase
MKLSPILKLVRLSALPSAWADQFGGMALAFALAGALNYRFDPLKILWLLPASLGVYLGGMALNDVMHVRKDRLLHKPRPIVTGELSHKSALAIALGLFAIAIVAGFIAGCGPALLALLALIALYNHLAAGRIVGVDVQHPKAWTVASVGVIALCRAIHVLLPLMAFAGVGKLPRLLQRPEIGLFAGSVFGYFCLVTIVSLFEDSGGGRKALRAVEVLLLPVTLALPAWLLSRPGAAHSPILGVFLPLAALAALLLGLWHRLDAARAEPTPPKLGAVVGGGIRAEALLMGGFALMLAPTQPWWGLLALAMFPAGAALSKWISPT